MRESTQGETHPDVLGVVYGYDLNVTVGGPFTPHSRLFRPRPCTSRVCAPAEPAVPPSAGVTREVRRCAERVLHVWRIALEA